MKQFRRAVILFSVFVMVAPSTQAQENRETANAMPTTRLTAAQWQAVEGYYQSTTNGNLYLQALAHDSLLLIKLVWMDRLDTLRPVSDVIFIPNKEGRDRPARTIFTKDPGGATTSVNYSGYTWNRVNDYKPVVVKEMPHTPAQLARFAGVYHVQNDSTNLIQIAVEGNDLVLKERENIHFVPQTELSFYKPDNLWYSLDFIQDAAGNITQALMMKHDVLVRNPKPAVTAAQLRSYEGKYRAKNDSDNTIQLVAHGGQLLITQLWDGKTVLVTPLADLYFYNKAQSYSLQFVRDADGKVRQAWLFNTTEFDRIVEN